MSSPKGVCQVHPGNISRVTWSWFCIGQDARYERFNGLMLGYGSREGMKGKFFLRLWWTMYFVRSACHLKMIFAVVETGTAIRRVQSVCRAEGGNQEVPIRLYCGSSPYTFQH